MFVLLTYVLLFYEPAMTTTKLPLVGFFLFFLFIFYLLNLIELPFAIVQDVCLEDIDLFLKKYLFKTNL